MPVSTFAIVVVEPGPGNSARQACVKLDGVTVMVPATITKSPVTPLTAHDDRKCRYGHTRQGGPLQLWEHLWRTRRVPDPGDADLAQRPDHAAGTNRLVVRYAPVESDTHIGCRDRAN